MQQLYENDDSIIITEFKEKSLKANLKMTHQRLEIYRELYLAEDHPSAETLHKRIMKRLSTISLDTVYRTLATFEKKDLITRIKTTESQARYEVERGTHHHTVCKQCGTITDFIWNTFDDVQIPKEITGWGEILKKNVVLEGICHTCSHKK